MLVTIFQVSLIKRSLKNSFGFLILNFPLRFIERWIFQGDYSDPFNEFLIDYNFEWAIYRGINKMAILFLCILT
jgi:hypothetical protein